MELKGILSSFQNSARGMSSQTRRLELVSNNIANADKVAKPGEEVYKKRNWFLENLSHIKEKLEIILFPLKSQIISILINQSILIIRVTIIIIR